MTHCVERYSWGFAVPLLHICSHFKAHCDEGYSFLVARKLPLFLFLSLSLSLSLSSPSLSLPPFVSLSHHLTAAVYHSHNMCNAAGALLTRPYTHPHIHSHPPIHTPTHTPIHTPTHPPIHNHPSTHLPIHPPTHPSTHPPTRIHKVIGERKTPPEGWDMQVGWAGLGWSQVE